MFVMKDQMKLIYYQNQKFKLVLQNILGRQKVK